MNSENSVSLQIKDAIRLAELRDKPQFVGFLNEEEAQQAVTLLKGQNTVNYLLWGGNDNALRTIAGIFPDAISPQGSFFPIKIIKADYPNQFKLSHRDFLGALMSLGIKRSCVGDIKISDGIALIYVKSEISDYIISQLEKIGRVGVKLEYTDAQDIQFKDDTEYLNITVSSLRLDNVVSAVLNLSRDKSSQAVKSGLVSVNHTIRQSPSYQLKQGDSIVFKGKGKLVLEELAGESKKGKKKLIIKKYR
ncbi:MULTISPECIES: RNA-binding protein [unclassified Ruminococcus]|uniref:YlmH family RNA-binding protein n=1 Tax=unclassified Ruminococcus TaxID=2608920 RepID=UPI00210974F3|nr:MULTISPECIES: YlmH/Sll1252 family protein [unclassified Ruminococcus]MCQ4023137.1 hypothetical protein [Ruminococcus sp. zg-924]MCQ4115092.1 hypothetical protein [Ruminococcus sp. zg-921]